MTESENGVRFTVRVQPRSSGDRFGGLHQGAVRIRLSSAPVDGAANAELIAYLADAFRVAKRAVTIVRGETSRTKLVEIFGVDARRVTQWIVGHDGALG